MKMLQTMSLSGSVALIFYVVIKLCGRRGFTYSFYKKMLMIAMVFFLFPFPEFIYLYADLLKTIFPIEEWGLGKLFPHTEYNKPLEHFIEYTQNGQFRINRLGFYIFTMICLVVMFIFMASYFYKSQKIRKSITKNTEQVKGENLNKQYDELKKHIKIRSSVELRVSENINSPITMGIIKPVIFIPKYMYDEQKMELMIAHELNHIKQKDMFFTIISFAILMLNFYNPLAYYLMFEWKRIVELACDEQVMKGMPEDERKIYGHLLVDMAEKEVFRQPIYALGFTGKKLITERIENVMNKRKMSRFKKVVAGCLVVLMTFASSLTVFAYKPDVFLEVDEIYGEALDVVVLGDEINLEEIQMDGKAVIFKSQSYQEEVFYLDENGELVVKELAADKADYERVGAKASCVHSYEEKAIAYHTKIGSGCSVKIYNAKKCKKCGYVKSKTLSESRTYTTCSH